jgi:DNA primase
MALSSNHQKNAIMRHPNFLLREARQLDIVAYLEKLGHYPQKIRNNDYWYLSPLREEKEPSFKVNRKLNVWYDHGLGKGENIIDLSILYNNCGLKEAMEKLQEIFSFHLPTKIVQQHNTGRKNRRDNNIEPAIKLISGKPITQPALCHYLQTRNIPLDIAEMFCKEIHYELYERQYFAIGFQNNGGGFELRNAHFKGTFSPKDFTFLNAQKWEAVAVFEGFIDFLSLIASGKQMLPELTNFLVLNSLSLFEKARPVMEQHERIYLLLDNDAAGQNCTKHALSLSYKYNDLSDQYQQEKDINEWLMKKKESEQHPVYRSGRRM